MSIPLKMLLIIVTITLTTLGVQSIAVNLGPLNTFFLGFLWGSITTTGINMFLTFTEDK